MSQTPETQAGNKTGDKQNKYGSPIVCIFLSSLSEAHVPPLCVWIALTEVEHCLHHGPIFPLGTDGGETWLSLRIESEQSHV